MQTLTLRRLVTATAVALVGLSSAGIAQAADPGQTSITVTYADLDLAKPQGVDTLYARLRGAAKAACGDYDARNLREKALVRECREEALANAVSGIGHAALTAKHLQRGEEKVAQIPRGSSRS